MHVQVLFEPQRHPLFSGNGEIDLRCHPCVYMYLQCTTAAGVVRRTEVPLGSTEPKEMAVLEALHLAALPADQVHEARAAGLCAHLLRVLLNESRLATLLLQLSSRGAVNAQGYMQRLEAATSCAPAMRR